MDNCIYKQKRKDHFGLQVSFISTMSNNIDSQNILIS